MRQFTEKELEIIRFYNLSDYDVKNGIEKMENNNNNSIDPVLKMIHTICETKKTFSFREQKCNVLLQVIMRPKLFCLTDIFSIIHFETTDDDFFTNCDLKIFWAFINMWKGPYSDFKTVHNYTTDPFRIASWGSALVKRADNLQFTQREIVDIIQTCCDIYPSVVKDCTVSNLLFIYISEEDEPRYNIFTLSQLVVKSHYPYPSHCILDEPAAKYWNIVERFVNALKQHCLNIVFPIHFSLQNCCKRKLLCHNITRGLPSRYITEFEKWNKFIMDNNNVFNKTLWTRDKFRNNVLKCWLLLKRISKIQNINGL